eukprot:TRINITY_DN3418_c0_g1_i1.p2 TRINITY_DN3418_c0_g1~~TRINITY_DN3418_c0_g1_i1.p2  ORF type:complete len:127 (-),score=11.99 TRINITY_DN3418_c0_g1_i1:9-335(-)
MFFTKDWNVKYGGNLNIVCTLDPKAKPCVRVVPEFNTLVLFEVEPNALPHWVAKVRVNKPRMAMTGWYVRRGSNISRDLIYEAGEEKRRKGRTMMFKLLQRRKRKIPN